MPRGRRSAEVIEALDAAHPGIKGRVLDDEGQIRRFVNVYLNDDDVRFAAGTGHRDPRRHLDLDHPGRRRRLLIEPERPSCQDKAGAIAPDPSSNFAGQGESVGPTGQVGRPLSRNRAVGCVRRFGEYAASTAHLP